MYYYDLNRASLFPRLFRSSTISAICKTATTNSGDLISLPGRITSRGTDADIKTVWATTEISPQDVTKRLDYINFSTPPRGRLVRVTQPIMARLCICRCLLLTRHSPVSPRPKAALGKNVVSWHRHAGFGHSLNWIWQYRRNTYKRRMTAFYSFADLPALN